MNSRAEQTREGVWQGACQIELPCGVLFLGKLGAGQEGGAGTGAVAVAVAAESFKYGFCIKLQFKLTFEWKVIA